jgi:hypothetical protein
MDEVPYYLLALGNFGTPFSTFGADIVDELINPY